MARRLVRLSTSERLPAGQLTRAAWWLLESGFVWAAAESALTSALRDAGVTVHVGADVPAAQVLVVLLDDAPDGVEVDEMVVGSVDPPGAALLDVVAVVDRLRSPGGCPWDAEQTHMSLMPYLLEETYEAYQALEDGDLVALREEIGDVLFQVAFHARLAEEAEQPWSIDDVAADLVAKLVRRHPHVFAATAVSGADEVSVNWEAIKAAEKQRESVTDGVPLALPALMLAATLQRKASRLGVPPDLLAGSVGSTDLGARLLALVAEAREAGLDPEQVLRRSARELRDRVAGVERSVRADGGDPAALTASQWRSRWPAIVDPVGVQGFHHVELWVPDLDRSRREWGWLLGQLGWAGFQSWDAGASWRCGAAYLVVEQSAAMSGGAYDRMRPGLNHLALHAGSRAVVDRLHETGPARGWTPLFAERFPYAGGPDSYGAYLVNSDGFEVELVAPPPPRT